MSDPPPDPSHGGGRLPRVDCYAGHRGEESPRRLHLPGRRVEVMEVLRRWREPDERVFDVRGDDGRRYRLRHDLVRDRWQLD